MVAGCRTLPNPQTISPCICSTTERTSSAGVSRSLSSADCPCPARATRTGRVPRARRCARTHALACSLRQVQVCTYCSKHHPPPRLCCSDFLRFLCAAEPSGEHLLLPRRGLLSPPRRAGACLRTPRAHPSRLAAPAFKKLLCLRGLFERGQSLTSRSLSPLSIRRAGRSGAQRRSSRRRTACWRMQRRRR